MRSGLLVFAFLAACSKGSDGTTVPVAAKPTTFTADSWTQPVPSWGSPVRLGLPVPLASIVLGPGGGFGAFGAHEGGHVEGLNHIWIPTVAGTTVGSWAAGKVTKIEDMGDRGLGNGVHEWFISIDYGQGLVGKHLDVDTPLVKVGDTLREGDAVARAPSAEFMLIDNNRTDGERTDTNGGSPVSPFDYLRPDLQQQVIARHIAEVVTPFFVKGQAVGNSHPWEPALTNKMLYHADFRGQIAGEWILTNKGWSVVDPLYFDVMAIHDVTNAYGTFRNAEMMDHDWGMPGSKRTVDVTWSAPDGAGKVVMQVANGAKYYGLYAVDESSGRAKLTIQWQTGGYPAAITSNAAVYVERGPIYLQGDAQKLGLIK